MPALTIDPEICPVFASTLTPLGNGLAEKAIGLLPDAGMVKKIGWPGRTPNTLGPLIWGSGLALGVKIAAELLFCAITAEQQQHIKSIAATDICLKKLNSVNFI